MRDTCGDPSGARMARNHAAPICVDYLAAVGRVDNDVDCVRHLREAVVKAMIPTLYKIPLPRPHPTQKDSKLVIALTMIVSTAFWYMMLVAAFGAIWRGDA